MVRAMLARVPAFTGQVQPTGKRDGIVYHHHLLMMRTGYRFDASVIWIVLLPLTLIVGWEVGSVAAISSFAFDPNAKRWAKDAIENAVACFPANSRETVASSERL